MKRMVMIAAVIMLGTLSLAQTSAPATMTADLPWTEDYAAAVTRAKQDHKLLLLNFTGSDWCVP